MATIPGTHPLGGITAAAPTAPSAAVGAASTSTMAAKSTDSYEFLEVNSVTLEWKLANLKQLFEQSKGETKSKCVKSSYFGQGKWQVFFYPNSGHDQYCSLYLSCQPTLEECERGALTAASGIQGKSSVDPTQVPWSREGLFKFTFEIKSLDRRVTFKAMEANDHAFSHEARNWGWAQYWRRNDAYYNNHAAKYNDAFLICCTIVYSPSPPSPPPPLTRRTVPNELLDAYASLFDDPANSDVCFRIVRYAMNNGKKTRQDKTLYASKKILGRRSEYFRTMFEGGFSEAQVSVPINHTSLTYRSAMGVDALSCQFSNIDEDESMDDTDSLFKDFDGVTDLEEEEDDEDEDDDQSMHESSDANMEEPPLSGAHRTIGVSGTTRAAQVDSEASDPFYLPALSSARENDSSVHSVPGVSAPTTQRISSPGRRASADIHSIAPPVPLHSDGGRLGSPPLPAVTTVNAPGPFGNQHVSISGVSGGRRTPDDDVRMVGMQDAEEVGAMEGAEDGWDVGAPRQEVNQGYRALLKREAADKRNMSVKRNMANESSGRIADRKETGVRERKKVGKPEKSGKWDRKMAEVVVTDASYQTFRALLYYLYTDSILFAPLNSTYICQRNAALANGQPPPYNSRSEHVRAVVMRIPLAPGQTFGVGPCSAKNIYRLADKIGLPELKARAFDHILRSLTSQNIPLEVFSSFTARYEEIRKVEIEFMLIRWNEVRDSSSLRLVLDSVRDGRTFNGFAGVWQILLSNLEYRPPAPNVAGDVKEGGDGLN